MRTVPAKRTRPARPARAMLLGALALMLIACPHAARGEDRATVRAFEDPKDAVPTTELDRRVRAEQRRKGVTPAPACSDGVFVRRVYLDAIGTLPTPEEVAAFRADRTPDRRARLVDALLVREEFADYWSLRWCDALRVKSEFPIKLWPNAVQAYHRWIHDSLRANKPYDIFAHELLTSSGSNFRVPQVNFLRAVQGREPEDLAAAAALTFMGARFDAWPQERRAGMAALFSRVAYKSTREWKEEIVLLDPAAAGPIEAELPDGTRVTVPAGEDPRRVFSHWLTQPDNPWFARAVVNRIWAWIFGRGLVHEADDLRPDNPPVIPAALDHLADELVASGYDLRHVYRLILRSRTYQQSPLPRGDLAQCERLFACYPVRRIDAEVLIDALCWVGGRGEEYESPIPEPFTFVPQDRRTIELADGSITSPFLDLFGRPPRDTGRASERSNQPTDDQRLHLLNSTDVRRRIESSVRLRQVVQSARGDTRRIVRGMYLTLLSRDPTEEEARIAGAYFVAGGRMQRTAAVDLAWALINTKEFLYRH